MDFFLVLRQVPADRVETREFRGSALLIELSQLLRLLATENPVLPVELMQTIIWLLGGVREDSDYLIPDYRVRRCPARALPPFVACPSGDNRPIFYNGRVRFWARRYIW